MQLSEFRKGSNLVCILKVNHDLLIIECGQVYIEFSPLFIIKIIFIKIKDGTRSIFPFFLEVSIKFYPFVYGFRLDKTNASLQ